MADEKIQFTIGSDFSDVGFTKANAAIASTSKLSAQAAQSVQRIGGAFTAMDGTVGKVTQGISGFAGVLSSATQGPVALFTAAAAALTSTIISWKKAADEAAAAHKKLMEEMRAGMEARMADELAAAADAEQAALERMSASAVKAVADVKELASAYKALAAAEDAAIGVEGNLKIAKINDEFAEQFAEACDELRPLVTAEKNLAIALEKQKTASLESTASINRAKEALVDIDQMIAKQKDAIAAQTAAGQSTVESFKALDKLQIERSAILKQLSAAEKKAEISELEHATAVTLAKDAVAKAEKSWDAVVAANEEEIAKMEAVALKEQALADAISKRAAVNQAAADALSANQAATSAIEADLSFLKDVPSKIDQGIAAYNKTHEWLKHDFKRDMDGKIGNFNDYQKAMDAYEREKVKTAKKRERETARARQKAEEIMKKREKDRTEQDKRYLDRYKEWKKQVQDEETLEKRKEELEREKKKILEDQKTSLGHIETALANQGLK